jgi:thiamine transporter
MFAKLAEVSPIIWVALGCVLLIAGIVFVIARNKRRWTVHMLVAGAVCLALSFVLSYIRLYRMPQGGSITPASMLPIMIFAYTFGVAPGMLVGFAYSLLQMVQDAFFVHPVQLLADYVIPFAGLALAGVFRDSAALPRATRLAVGMLLATVTRVLCHTISGAVFFAEYAGDMNPWVYSIVYNSTSAGLDGLICIVIALIPPVSKAIESIRQKLTTLRVGAAA